jgi:lipid II:glycine glycyltransferase (peptidoglycan interpeptide bridge formation enzyme)
MIKWAAEKGVNYFDFGQVQADAKEGTHAAGLYNFKEKWKPTLYDKVVFVKNKEISGNENHLQRAKKMWRKAPRFVTDLMGPFLVSRVGY